MDRALRRTISEGWLDAAEDALTAAHELRQSGRARSSFSRAYYASYSFLAAALATKLGVRFGAERDGPAHDALPDLVESHLRADLEQHVRRRVRVCVSALYRMRLVADYQPRRPVSDTDTLEALKRASTVATTVRRLLG
jgi:uncharacterized protein (UPF0332 family)